MSKKESHWFSHDSNAATHPKNIALIDKYGMEGYGRFWRIIERLRDCDEYRYDISVPFAWDVLGRDMLMSTEEAKAFVTDCTEYFQLFETDGKHIWSISLDERMEYWERRKEVLRERGRKGGKQRAANLKLKQDSSTSKEEPKHNEANQTKLNDTKPNKTKQNDVVYSKDDDDNLADEEIAFEEVASDNKEDNMRYTDGNIQDGDLEQYRQRALDDSKNFVYSYTATGRVDYQQLGHWLTAFNKWLRFSKDDMKTEKDYRRHFSSWFSKRDTRKENPLAYNPAGTIDTSQKPDNPVPQQTAAPPKTEKVIPLPIELPKEKPAGRYSKGNNKYDMHWLKNLRDDVRKIGG